MSSQRSLSPNQTTSRDKPCLQGRTWERIKPNRWSPNQTTSTVIGHAYGEEPEKKYIREMIAPPTMVGLAFGKISEGKNGFKRSSQQILGPSMTMRNVADAWRMDRPNNPNDDMWSHVQATRKKAKNRATNKGKKIYRINSILGHEYKCMFSRKKKEINQDFLHESTKRKKKKAQSFSF